MSDGVTFTVEGFSEWKQELADLPDVLQKRLMRGAVATGAEVIKKAIKAKAPIYSGEIKGKHPPPGTLKKSIIKYRISDLCTDTVEVWAVGVKTGKTAKGGVDGYYAKWVEYGHAIVSRPTVNNKKTITQRRKASTQIVPAHPFFRPGFESSGIGAIDAAQAYINENLPLATASMRYLKAAA